MPKDDYAKATAKDKGRRERARLDYEARQASNVHDSKFPRHEFTEHPDGTRTSKAYHFNVDRWN